MSSINDGDMSVERTICIQGASLDAVGRAEAIISEKLRHAFAADFTAGVVAAGGAQPPLPHQMPHPQQMPPFGAQFAQQHQPVRVSDRQS